MEILPVEIISYITVFLDNKGLLAFSLLSKHYSNLLSHDLNKKYDEYCRNKGIIGLIDIRDLSGVKYLVEKCGIDPMKNNAYALQHASEQGELLIVKYFIEDCTSIKYISKSHIDNSLIMACDDGRLEVIKYLVEKCHANVNVNNATPLAFACEDGYLEVVDYLISKGA